MESSRRIVAGRWQRAESRPGGEGMRYIQRGFVSPPRRGGDKTKSTMPRRIAIVEDDAAIRANYADALRKHGYEVSAFGARGEAMAAFRSRFPDLAVIDIGLGDRKSTRLNSSHQIISYAVFCLKKKKKKKIITKS